MKATKNRKAFTLIEVMVATILISVVGLSLMQMQQNSAQMSYNMQAKLKHSDWVLMSALETPVEKVKKNTSFSSLMKPFQIDKREIRKGLNEKVVLNAELFERLDLSSFEADEDDEDSFDEVKPNLEGFRLEVYKQYITMNHHTYSLFRVLKP